MNNTLQNILKEFDELRREHSFQKMPWAESFISQSFLKYRDSIIKEVERKRMTMEAAIETNSDVGAGYTLGFNSALDSVINLLKK